MSSLSEVVEVSTKLFYYSNLPGISNATAVQSVVYKYLKPLRQFLLTTKNVKAKQINKLHFKLLTGDEIREIYVFLFCKKIYDEDASISWDEMFDALLHNKYNESLRDVVKDFQDFIAKKRAEEAKNKSCWIQIVQKARKRKDSQLEDQLIDEIFRKKKLYENEQRESPKKVLTKVKDYLALEIDGKPAIDEGEIYFEPDLSQLLKQIDAIDVLLDNPHKIHAPLVRLFENIERARWPRLREEKVIDWNFLTNSRSKGLPQQQDFVGKAINTPDFAILDGPPGSGKTTAICEIIMQEVTRHENKIMLVASTHVAVDNVLERIGNSKNIVAIRIGDESDCSEKTKNFLIDRYRRSFKKKMLQFYQHLDEAAISPSQRLFFKHLLDDENQDFINNILMLSANLICGTTIGILQYPMIRAQKKDFHDPFDLLILDEASKTPLHEFLVPALYARRWILSGDPWQLSPYIDEDEVDFNVESLIIKHDESSRNGIITPEDAKIALDCFKASKSRQKILILSEDDVVLDKYKQQLGNLAFDLLDLRSGVAPNEVGYNKNIMYPAFLGVSAIVCTPSNFNAYKEYIPPNFRRIIGDVNNATCFKYRRAWLNKKLNNVEDVDNDTDEDNTWSQEVGWRLIRKKEVLDSESREAWNRYNDEIQALLPSWYPQDQQIREEILKQLGIIERIVLPSILDIMLYGTEKMVGIEHDAIERKSVFTAGFPEGDLHRRFTSLQYQYRMHEHIAQFPSEHVYKSKNLLCDDTLSREWDCDLFPGNHQVWVDVESKKKESENKNVAEIDAIMTILEKVLNWTRNNQKGKYYEVHGNPDEKYWKIAILSFYKPQVNELRIRLKKRLGSRSNRYFKAHSLNANIDLCTVDRFQGQEADIVLLSFVQTRKCGFLDCINRVNVAITRARFQNIFFGDREFFLNHKKRAKNKAPLLEKLAGATKYVHISEFTS